MLYSVVLVSPVLQHESAINIHLSPPLDLPPPLSHPPLLVITKHRAELCPAASPELSVLHVVVYLCPCYRALVLNDE